MAKETVVEIKRLNTQRATVELVGDTPLIVHAWDSETKRGMLDKQMKKATGPKKAKDPEKQYEGAFYRLADGTPGFPTIAFKAAAVSAAGRYAEGMKMTEVRGAFFIEGELVAIDGKPNMREDMVRVGMGTADLRYRPEFKAWRVSLPIIYNADAISLEQIVNILNLGGFGVGVGEWRPEKDGNFGRFHVATEADNQVKKGKK